MEGHAFPSIFQRVVFHQILGQATSLILRHTKWYEDVCLFSSPHPRDIYDKSSSLVVTADFHMKLPKRMWTRYVKHAFGFVHFCGSRGMVICNPSTGQLDLLPEEEGRTNLNNNLVFDPVDKQFKVLSIKYSMSDLILTRGTGDDSGEEIYCPLNYLSTYDLPERDICINGVFYYFAEKGDSSHLIVFFDVRSEEFKFIYKDFFERERKTYRDFIRDRDITKMIKYKGKVGVITLEYDYNPWDWDPNNSKNRSVPLGCICQLLKKTQTRNGRNMSTLSGRRIKCVGCSHVSTLWENQIIAGVVSVVGVTAK